MTAVLLKDGSPLAKLLIPSPGYEASIDFTNKPVGAMPATMDTGQAIVKTWNTTVAADPVISSVGGQSRYTIATTSSSAQAGYVTCLLAGVVTKLSVDFVYSVGIHAWRDPFPAGPLTLTTEGSVCHLGFDQTGWKFAVWTSPTTLSYVGPPHTYATARSATAVQHGEVVIDKAAGKAYVTGDDGVMVTITDSRISAYSCSYAQCEIYYNNAATEPRASVLKFEATSAPGGVGGGAVSAQKLYLVEGGVKTKVWPPTLPVSLIGVAPNGNAPTYPAHQSGDLLVHVWMGYTTPSTPSGWASVANGQFGSTGMFYRVVKMTATSTTDGNDPAPNGVAGVGHIYRGATTVGVVSSSGGNSNSVSYPAATFNSPATSRAMRYAFVNQPCNVNTGTISGYTNQYTAYNQESSKDSGGAVGSNPTAVAQGISVSNAWGALTIEIQ